MATDRCFKIRIFKNSSLENYRKNYICTFCYFCKRTKESKINHGILTIWKFTRLSAETQGEARPQEAFAVCISDMQGRTFQITYIFRQSFVSFFHPICLKPTITGCFGVSSVMLLGC